MAHRSDIALLFATRIIRLFCYGSISVVLALYLAEAGLSERQIGLLFTLTLVGDAIITLWLTSSADRVGRRRTLIAGALLMVGGGVVFAMTREFELLMSAAIIGVLSPSGKEIGPFLSVEQASLAHLLSDRGRTKAFAWYNLAGSFAAALGALLGGWLAQTLQARGLPALEAYCLVLMGYAIGGLILAGLFLMLSPGIEVAEAPKTEHAARVPGLLHSRKIVVKLSALFALDAFAGGLIIQSMMAYWFHLKFGIDAGAIGRIFFGSELLAGLSALLAVRIANKVGLIRTMVFTHIPSSILLILVPLMPTLPLAIIVLLLRFSISQMDVPTRQSYTMAVVAPEERSAAAGITGVARTLGASLSPVFAGIFLANAALLSLPFFISGSLKIAYDLALFRLFRAVDLYKERA
jgi:MFS family permease